MQGSLAGLLGEIARRDLATFNAQDMSNAVWAVATTGASAPGLLAAVEAQVMLRGLAGFKEQNISILVRLAARCSARRVALPRGRAGCAHSTTRGARPAANAITA